jgi:hypothetical protein
MFVNMHSINFGLDLEPEYVSTSSTVVKICVVQIAAILHFCIASSGVLVD